MQQDLLGRLVVDNITEFGRMANEMGYGLPAEEGGVNASVSCPTGDTACAGETPSVSSTASVNMPAGISTLAGEAPTPHSDTSVSMPAAGVSDEGHAPQLSANALSRPPPGSTATAGEAPSASTTAVTVMPAAGDQKNEGQAPSAQASGSVAIPPGNTTLEGEPPTTTIGINDSVSVPSGDTETAGQAPTVSANGTVSTPAADSIEAGERPNVSADADCSIPAGDVSTSGNIPSLQADAKASVPAGDTGLDGPEPTIKANADAPPYPVALQLYSTETGLPLATLHDFTSVEYSRSKNEAARVGITFPAGHPANKAIRDIYTAEPHGVYGVLYRRGQPWAGVVLAETDLTTSPISWSFLGFEGLLRNHKTPWNWHGLEGLTVRQALTTLTETGRRCHPIASLEGLQAATLVDTEVKTWAQVSGEGTEGGAYNQPLIILAKNGTRYKTEGTATFAFDLEDQLPLERIRWRCALGEYVHLFIQYRTSTDGVSWSEWVSETEVADQDYAESHGIAAAGTCRYVEVKFRLTTEDTSTEDQEGNAVGTSPVLFGLEIITTYATGISAYSIDVPDEPENNYPAFYPVDGPLQPGFDFSGENHLAALAAICEDCQYSFKIDYLRRLYVWKPAASSPIVVKKGETCEPQTVAYRSIDSIENVLMCYGAGEGLGRLTTILEDEASILIYGRRPGKFEDSKITTLATLTAKGQVELDKRAWPVLEAQICAPYEEGRGVLDAKLHDFVLYIDPDTFTGTDDLGCRTFEIISEQRDYSEQGEMVTLGLDSTLDNMFTRQAKQNVKRNYKHGKAVGQVPFDVRAIGAFASVQVLWHGVAQEYIVENSADGLGGWKVLTRTADTRYIHTQLATGATQYYRVRAVYDGLISGPSLVASATTTAISPDDLDTVPPAVPSDLAATTGTTQTTAGGIVIFNLLSWTLGTEDDLAYYELRRSEDNGTSWITVAVVPAGENKFLDTAGLKEATTYQYQIRAMDKVGNRSDWSTSASILTVKDAVAPSFLDTAPSVTAGFKRLVPRWHEAQAADISHYLLQRQTADAEWDNDTSKWKVPASPVAGNWADITGSAIRALQYHDTDVLFNTCYRYRVAAVDTSGNTSGWTLPSAWIVPLQVGTADAAFRFITAEMYGEIRNVLPYTFEQDVDSTHPVEVPFYIPSETTQIVSIKLSASGEKFRANSKSASAGGAHAHDVDIPDHSHGISTTLVTEGEVQTGLAGGHSHGSGFTGDGGGHGHTASSASDGSHSHGFRELGDTWYDGDPSHNHSFSISGTTDSGGSHNHSVNVNSAVAHKHSIGTDGAHSHDSSYVVPMSTTDEGGGIIKTSSESDAHTHSLVYGIYEAGTPNSVMLYVDNGAGYGTGIALATAPDAATPYALATELDITAHIAGSGWKRLKLTSSRLGTIALQLICKVDLTA